MCQEPAPKRPCLDVNDMSGLKSHHELQETLDSILHGFSLGFKEMMVNCEHTPLVTLEALRNLGIECYWMSKTEIKVKMENREEMMRILTPML